MRYLLPIAFSLAVLFSGRALAKNSTVLIPTLYSGPGAFGSRWWSAVFINNHSAVAFTSPGVQFAIECPIPEGCQSDSVPSGAFGAIAAPVPANGLLLH